MSHDILSGIPHSASVFTLSTGKAGRRSLAARNHCLLLDVPPNIFQTPVRGESLSLAAGCFLGFHSAEPRSRHVIPLGRFSGIPFMSIFRFKIWWTTHWTGSSGSDIEYETQFLLLDRSADGRPYVVLLPLVDGSFRASLQPGSNDFIDLCLESGTSFICASSLDYPLYIHAGDDPFTLVREAVTAVRAHLGSFKVLEEKSIPPIVDKFGWCTWDAFYLTVHPSGIRDGIKSLVTGGCPPGFVLIDDGWQSVLQDDFDVNSEAEGMNYTIAGDQMPCRLVNFQENRKFREYQSRRDGAQGIAAFVRDLKEEFRSVESVYVWHALCGYWGGVKPGAPRMLDARLVKPSLSPGAEKTMEDLAVDKIVNAGIGLVPPELAGELFEGLHSHLAAAGIDGVKVDVISIAEMLCEEYGGRVNLGKAYFKALTQSVIKHFNGNGVIASMEHSNDFMLLGTETISLGRVGDDFWCTDPSGDPNGTFWLQGCHMVHCAYNSLWMGNFIQPDWDMFQSTHPCAAFHAASRAISGGPIYISDSVGHHDFRLLKSIVLPDGSILRCLHYALPTKDCLFVDPLQDGKSILKIWNLNKFAGVVGAFNCQGGGWCRTARRNKCSSNRSGKLTAKIRPMDVQWGQAKAPICIDGIELFAVFFYKASKLSLLSLKDHVEITLDPFDYELLTISPVTEFCTKRTVQFAPIGLSNMHNTGGAVQSVEFMALSEECSMVKVEVKGTGEMKAFSSERPAACRVNGEETEFVYEEKVIQIQIQWTGCSSKYSVVEYLY